MAKKKREKQLKQDLRKLGIIFLSISASLIVIITVLFVLALVTKNNVFTLILAILFVLFTASTTLGIVYLFKQSYFSFFDNLLTTTKENYDRLGNIKKDLVRYEESDFKELKELNQSVDAINNLLDTTVFTNKNFDYDDLNLEYVNYVDKRLITLDSFLKNHKQFILKAELFRNAFIFFHYNVTDDFMDEDMYAVLYKVISETFNQPKMLLAKDEERHGYLVFVPYIDSISCLREILEKASLKCVVAEHSAGGAEVIKCQISAVIYPYSDISDIWGDLRYATRQNKDINIYTPKRINSFNRSVSHTSLTLNNIAKIFESLSEEKVDSDDVNKAKSSFQKQLRTLATSVGFETVGIAVWDKNRRQYFIDFENTLDGFEPVFKEVGTLDTELVGLLNKYSDNDSTYCFASRNSVNDELGYKFDVYGIKSGYFFVVRTQNNIKSVIYYLNKKKEELYIEAYNKESLMVFSSYVAQFSKELGEEEQIHAAERRYRSVLRLTDHNIYTIDASNHELLEISDGLIDVFGPLKQGELCYKKLYGLDAPCEDCPLTVSKKKLSKIAQREYITSLILQRKKEDYPTLLLSPVSSNQQEVAINRYDPQLLIHSCYGLYERLDNLFLNKNRGYVLFLRVDNFEELLEKYGEEVYQSRLRFFFKNYRKNHKFGDGEVYVYHDNVFAFVFPGDGRVDILNRSENIYTVSQEKYDPKDENEIPLKCTYVGLQYPGTYIDRRDFVGFYDNFLKNNYAKFHQELFFLPDTNYVRTVSREKFIISLLDHALETESLSLKYLPEVKGTANKIVGAEILLRLTDIYRNVSLSPYEFINVASKNNKIGRITDYLIARVGDIYQKYGLSAFKLAGLKSLSLNVDTTYFDDPNFIDRIETLVEKYHFQKGFLRLEFNEKDIADTYEKIKTLSRKFLGLDIVLTADNYTGEFISINRLKELGFTIIKMSRRLVMDLSKDPTQINGVRSIIGSIKEFGLNYCIVGVEDEVQYQMLKEVDPNFIAEGYYFYEPLDLEVFLGKLRDTIA